MNNKHVYPSSIESLYFYVKGADDVRNDSYVTISNKELFKGDSPVEYGVYDAHMGTTDHAWKCVTCFNKKAKCDGHPGSVVLRYPVKNPLFRDYILKWLNIICLECSCLMVKRDLNILRKYRMAEYIKLAKSSPTCWNCGKHHPVVTRNKKEPSMFQIEPANKNAPKIELYNHIILKIFEKVTNETVLKVGMPLTSHPMKFIINVIKAPPNQVRPDMRSHGGTRSSTPDITALLKNIVEQNDMLPNTIPEVKSISSDLRNNYYTLDALYFALVKGASASGDQVKLLTSTNKQPKSLAMRMPKKPGRFVKNILGKRCIYMVRSVITGDNCVRLDQIGMPISIAKSIPIPEVFSRDNYDILMTYFNNKHIYPGCTGIIRDGRTYNIDYIDPTYVPKIGDTILRHMIDDDVIDFNRFPTLSYTSISCMRVKILRDAETIRMNVSSCSLFHADFDGDNMNAIIPCDIMARNEVSKLTHISKWLISYKNSIPTMGVYQDSLIGTSEFTCSGVVVDKWHAMNILSGITLDNYTFDKKIYTNREIISRMLPPINMRSLTPTFYKKQYNTVIKYNKDDIEVNIVMGKLVSGILDKATIGQETAGTIFHVIANEYGPKKSLETIFSFHQFASRFFLYKGFTVGINDINVSQSAKEIIKINREKMFIKSADITRKLDEGKLNNPIGTTKMNYFENEQMTALRAGDDFIEPILSDIDMSTNGMCKLIMFGSKGNSTNFVSINGDIGQILIGGTRPTPHFAFGRTSPYFPRYDMRPKASGYVSTSYREGLQSDIMPFAASEGRFGLITEALTTAVTGYQSKLSTKSLETVILNNVRSSAKSQSLVQPLYGENGIDPRKVELVEIPTIMCSDSELISKFKSNASDFDTKNKKLQQAFDAEFELIQKDRDDIRAIFMKMSDNFPTGKMMMNKDHMVPVNVKRLIIDSKTMFDENDIKINKKPDPMLLIDMTKKLIDTIDYSYYNSIYEDRSGVIPDYIKTATYLLKILIRATLCVKQLIINGIDEKMLDIIATKTKIKLKRSLMNYGASVGVIAVQCITEPLTQYMLDSRRRSGGGSGTKTNTIERLKEIWGARPTHKMKNPSMLVMVRKEDEKIKSKVQEVANHIEMMVFERFIKSVRIFFEEYGHPRHPMFAHEDKMILHYEKYTGSRKPDDLSNWCIRYELIREEMLINSMKLETIINVLNIKYSNVHIVHTPENAPKIIMRCYIGNSMMKLGASKTQKMLVMDISDRLRNTVIRGVEGIKNTSVIEIVKPVVKEDGSIDKDIVYAIDTAGVNMEYTLYNEYIDKYRLHCDSIIEYADMFGIEAARNKIIDETLAAADGSSRCHVTLFADEMTYTGEVTSLQKTGMQKREKYNIPLRMSFQSPVQVMEDSAIHGYHSKIEGVSGALVVGTNMALGTKYNKIFISSERLEGNTSSDIEDEL